MIPPLISFTIKGMSSHHFADLPDYLYADEERVCRELLVALDWNEERAEAVFTAAKELVETVRNSKRASGEIESFLQQYSLNTEEGLALMTLAEALLRIPDSKTASKLIRDKIEAANWLDGQGSSKDWIVKAAGLGLMMTKKTLSGALSHIAEPVIRASMVNAMRIMGGQFVLGDTIETATIKAGSAEKKGYRMSYDMLGEGARTAADADAYFNNYKKALAYIATRKVPQDMKSAGISLKLSALHPRYDIAQKDICLPIMIERVTELAQMAMENQIPLTIDAEEVDRLEISLEIIEVILRDGRFKGWNGFGMAVQAYQKRALPLIIGLINLLKETERAMQIRLVKGAYWDTEIKHSQAAGLENYAVFTRKPNTDLSFFACAQEMLKSDQIYPMFATHNAHTIAAILDIAGDKTPGIDYEFQRLHGMGEGIYDIVMKKHPLGAVSIYAPVGPHADLLPYLVRRLLENGANTSFVNKLFDKSEPAEDLVKDPIATLKEYQRFKHPQIPLPADIYSNRKNSTGLDLKDTGVVNTLIKSIKTFKTPYKSSALIGGKAYTENVVALDVRNPANHNELIGKAFPADLGLVDKAFRIAGEGFIKWKATPLETRAQTIERYADLLEEHRDELIALCVREAGKTLDDSVGEIREAVDFCRYYAHQARTTLVPQTMPGYTGESNILHQQGRGVFVCISPWNFPLAIFTGQIAAALIAGNAVIAKPAEQTPLIAMKAVQLMHKAGIPENAINLMPGDAQIGAALVEHKDAAGICFTGSTEVAQDINATVASKNGAIIPFIAETGGQNALIVDSSALLEQVIDDVMLSAFGSAGQRCSALRILYLQEDIADKALRLLKGAMQEFIIGDPMDIASDCACVIDEAAYAMLTRHRKKMEGTAHKIAEISLPKSLKQKGHFFAPCAYELPDMKGLEREVFGPILHVIRYDANRMDDVIAEINATGYGLTLGIHSRIESVQEHIAQHVNAGNIYINRSQIGAVVGTQPFGGMGISGTGPKAGGPHYLARFTTEKVITTDTTACGGNASLISLGG